MLHNLRRKLPTWALALVALLLQLVLIFRAFGPLLTEPGTYQLVAGYDGMKNYYTFLAYLQQPFAQGLWWFGRMNYPFGDYIFYTDNTPLLALPLKLFAHYVYDFTPHALDVYHALLLSGLLLSTVLLVAILRRLLSYGGLVVVFSVVLVWLNPQTDRLLMGHYNLSFSWVLLFAFWGLLVLYERAAAGRPLARHTALVVAVLTLAAFAHLYYLAIVGLCTGAFFVLWLGSSGLWRQARLVLAGAAIVLLPLLLSLAVIRSVDTYYHLRVVDATGFDFGPWKLQFSALFQPYPYNVVRFIVEPVKPVTYESQAYLGAFALFGLVVAVVLTLVRWRAARRWWQVWRHTRQFRFLALFGGAALVGLFAALGTHYYLANEQFVLTNYLSAFFYLRRITDRASQFRAVARFSWPFFWAINFFVLVALNHWLRVGRSWSRWLVAGALVLLAVLDTRDTLKHFRHGLLPNVITNTTNQPYLNSLVAELPAGAYQALLPIPYFHAGSEDPALIVDDDDAQATRSFQLALRTKLPLLANKMSRTPPEHARALRSLFAPGGPDPALLAKLRGKPVLVFFDQRYYDGGSDFIAHQASPVNRQLLEAGAAFIERQHLTLLAESGQLRLYRWDVPTQW